MEKSFYITTPIYYVNAEPHIGHAYSTIVADFLKRFYKMRGYDSYFLTGTDEHGDKIQKAADENNSTPQEYTDRISKMFQDTWKQIGISNDDFIRTTQERHKKIVKDILQKVYDQGDIYFGSYGGHYCVGCERFLQDKDLVDGKCPEHNKKPEWIEEKNYFFKMKNYQGWLKEYIKENPAFIRPEQYRNEVLAMLENEELEDLCISRPASRLQWGIPLPFDENYVTYVWFDALINYISAIGYPDGEKFKKYWPTVNHIIAKDILKPHGIFWPTMLKAAGIEPYQHLNVHGYWNMADAKMSKSLGNVVRPDDLVESYGNDQMRYFFLREMSFGSDARFTEDAIIDRINFDLANDYGNLVNRTVNMTFKYFEGKVPARKEDEGYEEMKQSLSKSCDAYFKAVEECKFSVGIEALWEFIRSLNKYIDEKKPWALAKEEKSDQLASVMRNILDGIAAVTYLVMPICFNSAPKILSSLGLDVDAIDLGKAAAMDLMEDGKQLEKTEILFPKLEKAKPEEKKKATEPKKDDTKLIDINQFFETELKVAEIVEAEKIEGSDKLLKLQIDTGSDTRQIVAGIAQKYSPDEVKGKKIIVVANLKPAKIFGNDSNGMLLAAKKKKKDLPTVIFVDDSIETGSTLG